jgi:hypothetical protein
LEEEEGWEKCTEIMLSECVDVFSEGCCRMSRVPVNQIIPRICTGLNNDKTIG